MTFDRIRGAYDKASSFPAGSSPHHILQLPTGVQDLKSEGENTEAKHYEKAASSQFLHEDERKSCGVPCCSVPEKRATGNHDHLACVAVGSTSQENVDPPGRREEMKDAKGLRGEQNGST